MLGHDCFLISDSQCQQHRIEDTCPTPVLLWKQFICVSQVLSWMSKACNLQVMYSFPISDTVVCLVSSLSSQNSSALSDATEVLGIYLCFKYRQCCLYCRTCEKTVPCTDFKRRCGTSKSCHAVTIMGNITSFVFFGFICLFWFLFLGDTIGLFWFVSVVVSALFHESSKLGLSLFQREI